MRQPAKTPASDKEAAQNSATSARAQPATGHLYDHHDPIPVPEAHESDTESVWALFHEADKPRKRPQGHNDFRATEPAPLDPPADFDAPTQRAPLLSDFDVPTVHSPLPDGSGFDDTTRAAPLHSDFDAPTQASPLSKRHKPGAS